MSRSTGTDMALLGLLAGMATAALGTIALGVIALGAAISGRGIQDPPGLGPHHAGRGPGPPSCGR